MVSADDAAPDLVVSHDPAVVANLVIVVPRDPGDRPGTVLIEGSDTALAVPDLKGLADVVARFFPGGSL
jgi:hypothetical protein